MLKRILAVSGLFTLFAISPNVAGQSALTAKNSTAEPQPVSEVVESDRTRDGLSGPVRRVRTEVVKLQNESGRITEGKRALLEVVSYDVKGNKVENQYFPVSGATLTGKEVYKYDDKGNISEMTMLNEDGSLVSKEIYKYEFDFAGNWNKMTTSVALIDGGRVVFEPTEVTYRSIMYYLDGNLAKLMKPAAPPTTKAPSSTPAADEPPTNQTKAGASNHKESVTLPAADFSLEKVTGAKPADVSTVATTETKSPRILLDTEPPPNPRPILKPVSGGVLNGSAIGLPAPSYPDSARRMRISGTVVVEVVIDESGKVISARATDGPAMLVEAAVKAAKHAKFSPTKLSGQPVKVSGVINYKFTLTP
jgi:TonB family protein